MLLLQYELVGCTYIRENSIPLRLSTEVAYLVFVGGPP
jgi:hypothetical protein